MNYKFYWIIYLLTSNILILSLSKEIIIHDIFLFINSPFAFIITNLGAIFITLYTLKIYIYCFWIISYSYFIIFYAPSSIINYSSIDLMFLFLHIVGLSSLLGSINSIVTLLKSSNLSIINSFLFLLLYCRAIFFTSVLLIISQYYIIK